MLQWRVWSPLCLRICTDPNVFLQIKKMHSCTQTYTTSCAWLPVLPLLVVSVVCLSETVKVYFCVYDQGHICQILQGADWSKFEAIFSFVYFPASLSLCSPVHSQGLTVMHCCSLTLPWKKKKHKEYLLDRWKGSVLFVDSQSGDVRGKCVWCCFEYLKDNLSANFTKFALL